MKNNATVLLPVADHYAQARLFFHSTSESEQRHLVSAFAVELGKVETMEIRQRMLDRLREKLQWLGLAHAALTLEDCVTDAVQDTRFHKVRCKDCSKRQNAGMTKVEPVHA